LDVPIVTTVQGLVQPVLIVTIAFGLTPWLTVGLPLQETVTVAALAPPLSASSDSSTAGATNVSGSDDTLFKKETLFVENWSQGPERNHWLVPQSTTPAG
jgi:hypothetical protein